MHQCFAKVSSAVSALRSALADERPVMNALIDQADSIADEVITNLLGEERRRKLQNRERDQEVQKFLDCTASIWFIMVFRALIFNRSCIWVEPKRAGGIPSNLIPAKWHDSRIPIYLG